jgi:hypothetical protein
MKDFESNNSAGTSIQNDLPIGPSRKSTKPEKWTPARMADGEHDDFCWTPQENHDIRKSVQQTAADFVGAPIALK